MPLNGSGVFTRLYSWVTDRNNSIKITASRMDDEFNGVATALSNAIYKDGQQTFAANQSFGGYRITNLGNALADTDALNRITGDGRYIQQGAAGVSAIASLLDEAVHATTDVASAATCDIGAAATDRVRITGTTTITSLGTGANRLRFVHFDNALILTHNGTSLILPGGANITTAAGDSATFSSDASGNWRCINYERANGTQIGSLPLSGGTLTGAVAFPLGAVATPSVTFTSDLNTGIWSPAADTLAVSTNGTERLRVDSSGRLGINQASPDKFLHVTSSEIAVGATQISIEGTFNGYGAGISLASRTSNGGTLVEMARIVADASSAWNTTATTQDADLKFFTTLDGTSAERFRIASDGSLSTNAGAQPAFLCRAWVNFNGQGTVAIRSSGNVSSITDNGTGDYTVNFTTALADANYAAIASPSGQYGTNLGGQTGIATGGTTEFAPTTTTCRIQFSNYSSGAFDPKYVNFAAFR